MKKLNAKVIPLSILAHNKKAPMPSSDNDTELGGVQERLFIKEVAGIYYGNEESPVLPSDVMSHALESGYSEEALSAIKSFFGGYFIRKGNFVWEVIAHLITRNMWEYYILRDSQNSEEIKRCLVMGFETEIGDVSISELKGRTISATQGSQLGDIMPPTGWSWLN